MPTGKNAGYRYRIIDQALSNRNKIWRYDDLLEHVSEKLAEEYDIYKGISKRQFDDDLRIMRKDPPEGYGAPIIRKDGDIYYEDKNFSINNNPLNDIDIENLKEVVRLLRPFRSLPQLTFLENVVSRVQGTIMRNNSDGFVILDHISGVAGLEHLEYIYNLTRSGQVIKVLYKPFRKEERLVIIHPLLLREYNNRWFLQGWLPEIQKFTNLGLDRILNIETTQESVDFNKREILRNLNNQVVGISFVQDTQPVAVVLKFVQEQIDYILTKPIHTTQRIIEDGANFLMVEIMVNPNFELEQLILSFGERVEVTEPVSLRNRIAERIKLAGTRYSE